MSMFARMRLRSVPGCSGGNAPRRHPSWLCSCGERHFPEERKDSSELASCLTQRCLGPLLHRTHRCGKGGHSGEAAAWREITD